MRSIEQALARQTIWNVKEWEGFQLAMRSGCLTYRAGTVAEIDCNQEVTYRG